jgi:hypothetical protein
MPFHWEIEFPEVFRFDSRGLRTAGFDAFVGNPPFLGGTRISEIDGVPYFRWLVKSYPPCEHMCDLVAYFFRRCFDSLRQNRCLGLVATNTIAQGDTREGGLLAIIQQGGVVYSAKRRLKWPGQAAVVVSMVHVAKGLDPTPPLLDEMAVHRISAYLIDGATDESPSRLKANPYFSLGSKIYGQGFLFADDDDECTPLAEMEAILVQHPSWRTHIFPYLGGDEINRDPTQRPQRHVISLNGVASEEDLDQWPALRAIVEAKVKPGRMLLAARR